MNEIVNKFLLTGDKFMPEMHLRQPEFTYSACGACGRYQRGLASMVYKYFDKKSSGTGCPLSSDSLVVNNNYIKQNIQLADELHKPVIRKF